MLKLQRSEIEKFDVFMEYLVPVLHFEMLFRKIRNGRIVRKLFGIFYSSISRGTHFAPGRYGPVDISCTSGRNFPESKKREII